MPPEWSGFPVVRSLRALSWVRWTSLAILLASSVLSQSALAFSWSLALQQGRIGLALPDIQSGDWQVTGIRADLVNAVEADNRNITVHFKTGSVLQAESLVHNANGEPTQLAQVQVELSAVTLVINLGGTGSLADRSTVTGNVIIDVGEVRHPYLKPQSWRFEGKVAGAFTDLTIEGRAQSASGLAADVVIHNVLGNFLAARVATEVIGGAGGKALASTLADWPELLELTAGRVKAEASLRIEPDEPLVLDASFNADGVDGLMDRTALTGLNGRLLVNLEDDTLTAHFRDLAVAQINSGIGIGPIRFLADYRAPRGNVFGGILSVQQANADFLDGRLRVAPGAIDLGAEPWTLPVDVYEVSLERLLQVYPAEGFSGTGELTGLVPIQVSSAGIEVHQGTISAIAPGGLLRLPAERLQAMLGSSEAMAQVVDALQNFHYSVLDSTIDYDDKGRLILGLRLEGQNPEVRGGRPVVLNINLEEDIPALLTSLQLSGRVNEAVTERVQERLKQSGQEAEP
ncbi:YdbH domain-containing protein [Marinobacter sp. SS5-14b]|uniref:YdbH domain-containing protein n=1 Tax=Marinobacter sp. SS5-14b TaxID=3050456 RepID=UPI0026DFADF8|nr:YdbH domain-containing protein [Marinobacter sp. SS5-14b]